MNVALDSLQVLREHIHFVESHALLLALLFTDSEDAFKVLVLVELRNIAGVQDVVDIFKHLLVDDLGINEQEGGDLGFDTGLHEAELQVVSPISHTVALHHFDLVELVVAHESRKLAQRLTSRTTDTEQQSVSLRLSKNSADSTDVVACIKEHHELHGMLTSRVEVFKVLVNLGDHDRDIFDLYIRSVFSIDALEIVTEDDSLDIKDLVLRNIKLLSLSQEEREEYFLVLFIDHSVSEHSLVLMDPQPHDIGSSAGGLAVGRTHTLEDLGDISQVESVMRLAGSRSEPVSDTMVHNLGAVHDLVNNLADSSGEATDERLQDLSEDHADAFGAKVSVSQEVEVAHHTSSDGIPTTSRRSHGGDEDDIFNLHEGLLLLRAIVPTLVVHPLAKDFNRRLGSILFLLGHVQIIDEDDESLASGRSINTLSSLFELLIEGVLSLVRRGLCREGDGDVLVVLGHVVGQQDADIDGLTSSRGARAEDVLLVHKQDLLQVLHSDRIESRHYNITVRDPVINMVFANCIRPLNPLLLGLVPHEVVDHAFVREANLLRNELSELVVEFLSAFEVGGNTDGPSQGEDEELFQRLLQILNVFGGDLFDLALMVLVEVAIKNSHQALDDVVIHSDYRFKEVLPHEAEHFMHVLLEEALDGRQNVLAQLESIRQRVHPAFDKRVISQSSRLHVHHTAARHRGGRGSLQIFDLEHHSHAVGQSDDLSGVEAELLVVIEHSVHVLDPNGVDGAVENEPSAIVGAHAGGHVSELDGEDSIRPVMTDFIEVTVELSHGDGLGVESGDVSLALAHEAFRMQLGEGEGQHLEAVGLAGEGQAHNHESMPDNDHFVKLDGFHDEVRVLLQVVLLHAKLHAPDQVSVVGLGELHSREEIGSDVLEEREIVSQELSQVDIVNGTKHEDAFILVDELSLQVTSSCQHRLDCSHTVIIMLL
mmetsp:Transcript_11712/g.17848  ORF Transcript_11712/g.17848 Transcript_11712/m.17848 type:complete len:936 (+) Transcript_11712:4723-7530(+)